MSRPTVVIADDHTLIVEAFEKLLAPECDVVGTVGDGRALLDAAAELKPQVVVLDVMMPLLNGLDAGKLLKKKMPGVKLVYLTQNEDPDLAAEALNSGASAYLLKRSAGAELLHAIHEAMRNRVYVTPLVGRALAEGPTDTSGERRPRRELTPRQREVLQLLAEGHSMKQAAAILKIAPRTVAFHKYQMQEQLGLNTTAELIQYAIRQHLV
jgi:DNA-binding NarL/FixJ family response regulator